MLPLPDLLSVLSALSPEERRIAEVHLALLRLDPDQLAVVKTAHDFTGEDLRWLSLTVATTIETLITQSGDQLTSLEQAASAVEYLTSLLDL